ncbi:MAG TPA: hypothetical protein DC017_09975, partial [Candidatus Wallbacteria bacterium]|nr:hypothetical protein [Candidatus Wallbacteria bacterium]
MIFYKDNYLLIDKGAVDMNKSECVKHIKKEGPGKVYFKNLMCLVAVLAVLATFSYTGPDGTAYAQDAPA